ncbi:hypothetical protein F6455_07615 [Proteobacteria bacterium 005FR1]|nr:hypothetical protein [Proteobacteria bacterium 005FR1]
MKQALALALLSFSLTAQAQQAPTLAGEQDFVYGRWLGAMGGSGLRRSLANGSDLGELINRTTSYKMAAQVQAARQRQAAAGAPLPPVDFDSETDAWVVQHDSLVPLFASNSDLLFRGSIRRAQRYEDDRVDATADRVELGLFDASMSGYLGLSLMVEQSAAELGSVKGHRDADGLGLRFDYGRILDDTWAVSGRLEHAWWDGDGLTHIPTPAGTLVLAQDTEFERSYLTMEVIGRYDVSLPVAGQLRWRSGIHYLRNNNDRVLNSLGQVVQEPFGEIERLGLLRTGAYYSWRAGERQQWSPFVELMYDYEFANNMDRVIEDPHTITAKAGLARLIKPGWRAQLDVQRYQGLGGERSRNGATLAIVIDL